MTRLSLRIAMSALLVTVCGISAASADTVTLKDGLNGYAGTSDVWLERSNSDLVYNHGGDKTLSLVGGGGDPAYRMAVVAFDLSSLTSLGTLNSATLRLYRVSGPDAGTVSVNRMTESWTEGTAFDGSKAFTYDYDMNGANAYVRQAGIAVDKTSLVTYDYGGTTLYYGSVSPLADDPTTAVARHLIRRDNTTTGQFRGWDFGNRLFTQEANMDALVAAAADSSTNVHYYYDSAQARVYIRSNTYGFHYWTDERLWTDAINGSGLTSSRGVRDGSIDEANTYTDTAPSNNWYEIDITAIVQTWLADPSANSGVRIMSSLYNSGAAVLLASADAPGKWDPINGKWSTEVGYVEANGIAVQPELVIDFTPVPEPATLALLAAGGLTIGGGAIRRRRG